MYEFQTLAVGQECSVYSLFHDYGPTSPLRGDMTKIFICFLAVHKYNKIQDHVDFKYNSRPVFYHIFFISIYLKSVCVLAVLYQTNQQNLI